VKLVEEGRDADLDRIMEKSSEHPKEDEESSVKAEK